MKPLFALLALVVAFGLAFSVATPSVAMAQGAPPTAARPGAPQVQVVDVQPTVVRSHGDIVESHGRGMALLFWMFAAASIAGALFVISRRNLIAAVMGMVGSFMGIAAIYMMLYAQFLAVIQMLVYAGAIMVLFVFVIMILNRPEDEPVAPTGRIGQAIGGVAIIYLVGRLAMLLIHVELPNKAAALAAPPAIMLPPASQAANGIGEAVGWGTVKSVGNDLFTGGLFPFEAISILLLVAVVGAIAIARPLHSADGTSEDPGDASMNDLLFDVGYGHFLALSAVLFLIGMVGVLLRRNALIILMSVELMLNSANVALLTFARMWANEGAIAAHTFALIVIGVAAAEAAVGLAIVVAVFRGRHNVDVDKLTTLRH